MKHQDFIKHVRENAFLKLNEIDREEYPCLQNLSSAFAFKYLPIPEKTKKPEFIYVKQKNDSNKSFHETNGAVAYWNQAWEAGHLRFQMLRKDLTESLKWLSRYSDKNIYLIPHKQSNNYYAFQHILNLIPAKTRHKNGLPLL